MKFRKKPVIIDAVQLPALDEPASEEVLHFLHSMSNYWESGRDGTVIIYTLEGNMEAQPLDWIIRGVAGEYYPCKPDIFDKTYEAVQDEAIDALEGE